MTLIGYLYVVLFTARRWARLTFFRVLVCPIVKHRYKFGPRGCIRCGKSIYSRRTP